MDKPVVHNKYHKTAPEDAVYVGRGTPFGNPYIIGKDGDRDEVCEKYERYLRSHSNLIDKAREELKGKDLVCFCAPKRCHADTLLEVSNTLPTFKLLIAGGRDFTDYTLLCKTVDYMLTNKKETHKIQIISGTARGADKLGERYAGDRGYGVLPYPADWTTYRKAAGHIRNAEMLKVADAVIVCWDTVSRGSKNMKEITEKSGKPLKIIYY